MSDSRSISTVPVGMMVAVNAPTILDAERCYRAAASRDVRFDGHFFVAVRTTGIYCRPSCPAMTPKRANVEFFVSAAAAQQRGFRACKRCRPDAVPGSPEWNTREDVVARAMRLIADGVVDRSGVDALSDRLGYSSRHLNRMLTEQLGAGPLALARSRRAHTARVLIETTDLPLGEIAFAAGFGSIRQFNDTIREVYAASPSQLRSVAAGASSCEAGSVTVRLPARPPFAGGELFEFLGRRAVPGVETWDGATYERALDLPFGHGVVEATPRSTHVDATLRLSDWRDFAPAVERLRHLFDLDADTTAVEEILGAESAFAGLIADMPGRRVPGTVSPAETLVRAIVGQQVSVSGARTVLGRIVAAVAEPLQLQHPRLTHVFASMERLATLDPGALPMPASRGTTLVGTAERVATGAIDLGPGLDRSEAISQLREIRGIGPWTTDYLALRGFGDPDVFLDTDLGVRQGLERAGLSSRAADRWRPWRSYATHLLWALHAHKETS